MSKDAIMPVVVFVWDSFDNQQSEHISLSLGVHCLILLPSPKQTLSPAHKTSLHLCSQPQRRPRLYPATYLISYRILLHWMFWLICLMSERNNVRKNAPPTPGNLTNHGSLESATLSLRPTTAQEHPGSSRQSTVEAQWCHQHTPNRQGDIQQDRGQGWEIFWISHDFSKSAGWQGAAWLVP